MPVADLASLRNRTTRDLVLVVLSYRALGTLASIAGVAASGSLSVGPLSQLLVVTAVVLTADLVRITRSLKWGASPASARLVVVDITVALALNLWAAHLVRHHTLFLDYGNPFSVYAVASLALFTGVAGPRAGLVLLTGMVGPLQIGMSALNGIPLSAIDWDKFSMRALWFITALVLVELLLFALRWGARAVAVQSEHAGRAAQRAEALADLHDTVLQTLGGIDTRSRNVGTDAEDTLDEIAVEVGRRTREVEKIIRAGTVTGGLHADLRLLAKDANGRGIVRARLVAIPPEPQLEPEREHALVGAAGEALRNAERHGCASEVTIRAETMPGWSTVTITDNGIGFDVRHIGADAYGIRRSINERLANIDGRARLETSPGHGTKWELSVPSSGASGHHGTRRPRNLGPSARIRRSAGNVQPLVERALLDLAVVAIAYRALGLLISTAGILGSQTFGSIRLGPLFAVMAAVFVSQVALVLLGFAGWLPRATPGVAGVDLAITGGLNLVAAALVPTGTVFLDYRDPFGLYAQGTVALWTGARGPRLGVPMLIVLAFPLQVAMALVNGIGVAAIEWPKLVSRALWLLPAYALAYLAMSVARGGAQFLAAERRRAGLEAERAEELRVLHKATLRTLRDLEARARHRDNGPRRTLDDVGAVARQQAARLRAMLSRGRLESGGIYAELAGIVADTEGRGLIRPSFVHQGPEPVLAAEDQASLISAIRGALVKAETRGACTVAVYVEVGEGRLRAVVRSRDRVPSATPDAPGTAESAELPTSASFEMTVPVRTR